MGVAIGIVLSVVGSSLKPSTETPQPPEAAPQEILNRRAVTAIAVEETPIESTLEVTGTVQAQDQISIYSSSNGLKITSLLVKEGDYVKAGQTLARLDLDVLKAQLAQAEASVSQAAARLAELQAGSRSEEIARAEQTVSRLKAGQVQAESDLNLVSTRLRRFQNLAQEGAISQDDLDGMVNQERSAQARLTQAQAAFKEAQQQLNQLRTGARPEQLQQAQAQLQQAQAQKQLILAQIDNSVIVAPRSGLVLERQAQVGELTSGSDPLFTLAQDGALELELKVPELDLGAIAIGQKVKISSDFQEDLTLEGTVQEVLPVVDSSSRQGLIKVTLPPSRRLKVGMFLRAQVVTAETMGVVIPNDSVLPTRDGEGQVFLLQGDQVAAQTVTLGRLISQNQIQVVSGLNPGDRIVVKGASYVKDGDGVKVVTE